jgi:hypothetical protein
MNKHLIHITALLYLFTNNALAESSPIVNMNEKVFGKSLGEYGNLWWQWASSMPAIESPVRDMTGLKCDVNQTGHVWFLAGGYGSSKISRKCSIPKGNFLFFPVINMLNYPNGNANLSCESVKSKAAMNNDYLRSFVVNIDQHKIVNPVFHRYSSPDCFDLLGKPPKNPQSPTVYPSATDGYWVMLKPLPLGKHTIKFRAKYHNPEQAYGMMIQDIEYQIDIVESAKPTPQFKPVEEKSRPFDNSI